VEDYLSPEDWQLYLSLVGADGWCIHYDRLTRRCGIYEDRPRFCRVQADVFAELYDIEPEELNDFAITCCQEQISAVYGEQAWELQRFNHEVGV
jgi:Fe-S-cluster containining protein